MKKYAALLLSVILVFGCSMGFRLTATAGVNAEGFHFPFDSADEISDTNLALSGTFNEEGANGGTGSLAASLSGVPSSGVKNVVLNKGTTYEASFYIKFTNAETLYAPDIHLFVYYSGSISNVYSDPQRTTPTTTIRYPFNLYTVKAEDAGLKNSDGTCSDQWAKVTYTFRYDGVVSSTGYLPLGENKFNVFLRFGKNPHDMRNAGNFINGDVNSSYDFLLDEFQLVPVQKDSAIFYNSFDTDDWKTEGNGSWSSMGTAALTTDVPSENKTDSHTGLEVTKTAGANYFQIAANVSDRSKMIWYNRPYKITFWAKGSQAVVDTAAAVRAGNPGKGSDASFDFIIERVSSSRAVRLQHCYEEIGMEQPLSTQWQKYEFIYYREADYMLGRTGEADYHYLIDFRQTTMPAQSANCTYTYTDENGDTQTYQMSDYKFWIDNISVVELENVYDMDNAENTALKVAYNGNIVSSADFLSSLNNGAEITDETLGKTVNVPQGQCFERPVDIEYNRLYKLSFWYKGTAGDSLKVALDRSIKGTVLDNTVTAANTLGYYGYGNSTESQGDIPFYLYGGSIVTTKTHTFDKLELFTKPDGSSSETLIYDDYYDRLTSKNTQANMPPSAWNYQYYNGTVWENTNDAVFGAAGDVSSDWKYFECNYVWNYEGAHYRMPRLNISANHALLLADLKISDKLTAVNPFDESGTYPELVALDFEDTLPDTVDSKTLALSQTTTQRGMSRGVLKTVSTADGDLCVKFSAKTGMSYDISVLADSSVEDLSFAVYGKSDTGEYLSNTVATKAVVQGDGWTRFSGTYTSDGTGKDDSGQAEAIGENGFIAIKVGAGEHQFDELLIIPKFSGEAVTKDNLVPSGGFNTQDDLVGWSYSPSAVQVGITTDAANGTAGAMEVVGTGRSWGNVSNSAAIRFGRKYEISFWAKALDSETVGKTIDFILDRGQRTDLAAPQYQHLRDNDNKLLTADWVKYTILYQDMTATTDTSVPKIYFRIGSASTETFHYVIDELSIVEIENSYSIDAQPNFILNEFSNNVAKFSFAKKGNAVGAYYRLMAPFGGDYAIIDSGYLSVNETAQFDFESAAPDGLKLQYNAADPYGVIGATNEMACIADYIKRQERIIADFDTSIWTDDMASLDATVTFQGGSDSREFTVGLAFYDASGNQLSVSEQASSVAAEATTVVHISKTNETGAQSAKLFVWEPNSTTNIRQPKEIEKLTSADKIFIDPENGDDLNAGTFSAPVGSLSKAKSMINDKIAAGFTGDVYAILMPGEYSVAGGEFALTGDDSSSNVNIFYISYKPGEAKITGGQEITGFELFDANKNIYRASVGTDVDSRQLYVNGVRAIRARSEGRLANAVNLGKGGAGLTTTDTSFLTYEHLQDVEMVFYENWTNPRCCVQSAELDPSTGVVTLTLNADPWTRLMNKGNCVPTVPEYYENAYELLDSEGEFYLDKYDGYLYYKPRAYENMATAQVTMPVAERIMSLTGTAENPVKNITFRGISFEYSTWNDANGYGYVDNQNNNPTTATRTGFIPGAVELKNVHNVDFYNCDFSKIGQTGVKMMEAIQNCDFVGNEVYDTSGGAVFVGEPTWTYARAPHDAKYYQINNNVTDNYIHDISVEFRGGAAISAAYPKNMNICNNEVYNTSYSAVHTGWGWGSTAESGTVNLHINNNYLHKILNTKIYDGGGIYTLGHTGGSLENMNEMCGNYCYDIGNRYGVLYPDEGSSYWLIKDNVVDQTEHPLWYGKGSAEEGSDSIVARWTHIHINTINNIHYSNNYSTTTAKLNNGTDIDFEEPLYYPNADWPQEARTLISESGIRENYRDNFRFGLQEVYTAEEITVEQGSTAGINFVPTTSKKLFYDATGLTCVYRSKNPEIATVNTNGIITGVSVGTAKIELVFVENGIERVFECKVNVV